jgi:hypothetical protein
MKLVSGEKQIRHTWTIALPFLPPMKSPGRWPGLVSFSTSLMIADWEGNNAT